MRYTATFGDADAAFAKAEYTRKETFRCHRLTGLPLETRGQISEWDAAKKRLTVFGATKVLFFNRRTLAPMLGVTEADIDMIEVDVGGGFGVKGEFYPEDFLIPFAARLVGRPVKWIEDRREHLVATNHSREVDCELEIACNRDGTILAMRGQVSADMGAYIRTNGGVVPAKAAQFLPGPYRIRDIALTVEAFVTSKTPVGTLRAPGRFEANFFRERLLDIVADDLGLDPMEFRRKNLIKEAELPFHTGKLVPYEPETDFDTGDYHVTFERAVAEIGWDKNKSMQGRLIDGRYHGLAAVPFVESGGSGKENSRLVIEKDGSVSVYVGSSVLGQGLETTLAQVAADTLKLPFERIRILHGSTTYLKEGFGTFASRSMVVGGCAVMDGCNNLLAAIRAAATERLGFPNEEIEIADGDGDGRRQAREPDRFRRPRGRGHLRDHDPHLQLRRACLPRRGRSAHRPRRYSRLRRDRGRRRRDQSAHRPRPGDRRAGAGARRRVPRPDHVRPRRADAQRLADGLSRAACRPTSPTCAPSPWNCAAPRPIRSAPRARARAAWWRSRRAQPMRWRPR